MPRKPSAVQLQALRFIEAHAIAGMPFTCTAFSNHLWDTSTWERHAIGSCGGAYLWRLTAMGLIEVGAGSSVYRLTEAGRERLERWAPPPLG